MICSNCGFDNQADALFCEQCGVTIKAMPVKTAPKVAAAGTDAREPAPGSAILHENGRFCWVYEYAFWKNPVILKTTMKVLALACLGPALLLFFLTLSDGLSQALHAALTAFGICIAVLCGLLSIAYPLVCFLYGGRYCVLFQMDNQGVDHIQLKKQFRKAQALGFLTSLLGAASSSHTAAGAGFLAATRQHLHTTFAKVKSVKIDEKRHMIYLSETLTRNQVYTEPGDFQKVKEHILRHCPKNAKVRG